MPKKAMTQRLFFHYSLLMFLLIIGAAVAFLIYTAYTIENDAAVNISRTGDSITGQIDMHIQSMDTTSIDIATDVDMGNALAGFEMGAKNREEATREINQILIDNYKNKNDIYRITVVSPQGDVFSTGICDLGRSQARWKIAELGWPGNKNLLSGRKIIERPRRDFWDAAKGIDVISEVRVIRHNNEIIGYLEIQQRAETIESLCNGEWNHAPLKVAIVDDTNRIFYSNFHDSRNMSYLEAIFKNPEQYYYTYNTFDEAGCILCLSESQYTSWTAIFIIDKSSLFQPLAYIMAAIFVIVALVALLTILFIRHTTIRLTNPINSLVREINKIDLDHLTISSRAADDCYEASSIYRAFSKMMKRLNDSLSREKMLQQLQMKANFDMLQSEIGPHFLYNTLGSIANMCEMRKIKQATDACYDLSDLLRYSANYQESVVCLKDELENLKQYFSLMKCRYRQRLSYRINFEEAAMKIAIPKLTLQPFAENAIKYSLIEKEFIFIEISAGLAGGELVIEILDNGRGFSGEQLKQIDGKYREYAGNCEGIGSLGNIRFGGMGLLGTLLRLYLYFKERFRYEIGSNRDGGARISLHIRQQSEKDLNNVQNHSR